MIDGSEKRNRQLAFELQNSHVCEKRSKFWFLLFLGMVMYDNDLIMSLKQKKKKLKPRIKLNHNIYIKMYF